jgi:aminopeptidase N
VLTVATSCSAGASSITVTQQRFVGSGDGSAPAPQTWTLPACFKIGNDAPRCEVIDRPTQVVKGGNCTDAVFANAGSRGYYVTDYAAEPLRSLTRSVATSALAPVERLSLVGDEWWMVRSGRHDIDGYLDLAAALAGDDTAAIATTMASRIGYTGDFIAPDNQPRFQEWVRGHFGPVLSGLGVPGVRDDDDQRQSRRASLLHIVGVTGDDPGVQRVARDLATRYLEDPNVLPPTIASEVLRVAALHGDAALYDRYMGQLQKVTRNSEEYYRAFTGLAWFSEPALIRRTLDFTVTAAARSQDVGSLLAELMRRPPARDLTWAFIKAQWTTLFNKVGAIQAPTIVSAAGNFCSLEAAVDVRQFFAQNPVPSSARTLQQAIERIESCAAMRTRQSAPLARYLAR